MECISMMFILVKFGAMISRKVQCGEVMLRAVQGNALKLSVVVWCSKGCTVE